MGRAGNAVNPTPELLARIEAALDEGMSYKHAAEAIGVNRQFVARHFPGRGWGRKQISEHGANIRHFNEKMRK